METANAFIGKTTRPTEAEVEAALGSTATLWKQLVSWMAEQGVAIQEWNSYSPRPAGRCDSSRRRGTSSTWLHALATFALLSSLATGLLRLRAR